MRFFSLATAVAIFVATPSLAKWQIDKPYSLPLCEKSTVKYQAPSTAYAFMYFPDGSRRALDRVSGKSEFVVKPNTAQPWEDITGLKAGDKVHFVLSSDDAGKHVQYKTGTTLIVKGVKTSCPYASQIN
ncbi:hypothetical protein T439DRAFT_353741 [Meredithblackwellia eburnea MCA 4105]